MNEVPIFYPNYDEFKDFSTFISSIEARGAHRIGLAKIVPPKEWKARQMGYKQKQIEDKMVENPIKQEVHGKDGVYSVFNIQQRSIKLNSFQKLASSNRYATPHSISNDLEKLEKKYWQSLTSNAPIYGAGTFFRTILRDNSGLREHSSTEISKLHVTFKEFAGLQNLLKTTTPRLLKALLDFIRLTSSLVLFLTLTENVS